MRALGTLVLIALCSIAHADTAPELQAKGEELAKTGHFSEAIDAFKAADKIQPTAGHMCLIALVYIRRELWPQAEIHLDLCRARATAQDPLPDWFEEETKQLADRLATANVAPIDIVVEPPDAKVELTVSSFAPDEQFEPRTIHLPPGHHVIIARAPGYLEIQKVVAPPRGTGRIAFVASQAVSPAVGIPSMDAECAREAMGQGLPGTFSALVATTTASAASRFTTTEPWFRPDGVKVTTDLVHLFAPIDVNAAGQYAAFSLTNQAWTGAADAQTPATASSNCSNWSQLAATMSAKAGDASIAADGSWFATALPPACSVNRPVYCLQQ